MALTFGRILVWWGPKIGGKFNGQSSFKFTSNLYFYWSKTTNKKWALRNFYWSVVGAENSRGGGQEFLSNQITNLTQICDFMHFHWSILTNRKWALRNFYWSKRVNVKRGNKKLRSKIFEKVGFWFLILKNQKIFDFILLESKNFIKNQEYFLPEIIY